MKLTGPLGGEWGGRSNIRSHAVETGCERRDGFHRRQIRYSGRSPTTRARDRPCNAMCASSQFGQSSGPAHRSPIRVPRPINRERVPVSMFASSAVSMLRRIGLLSRARAVVYGSNPSLNWLKVSHSDGIYFNSDLRVRARMQRAIRNCATKSVSFFPPVLWLRV